VPGHERVSRKGACGHSRRHRPLFEKLESKESRSLGHSARRGFERARYVGFGAGHQVLEGPGESGQPLTGFAPLTDFCGESRRS